MMAFCSGIRLWTCAIILYFCFTTGYTSYDTPQVGEGGGYGSQVGQQGGFGQLGGFGQAGGSGTPQIITKALSCFGDKYIYQSCEESYRLDQSGELHVPPQYVNEYCDGPCQKETNLVLHCLQGIFANFIFYNKATIGIIKDTIHEGCSYGPERGNFDVAEHLQADSAFATVSTHRVILSFVSVVVGFFFIL
ncbi:hypothetical protein MLD38_038820 [Melastoma candidum]|uniref:Uncharacterized protein n=1 Tax=Melastoma candidum TaxID=119954 RepID=A0ACB9L1C3_9MYRT|nr:hypothetical protein MLD38_038820 [Melastoma candidum]